ncbi:MAG TPA: chromosome condensation protein CrcB [Elusimicrobia bacterium]|nr:MAG: hypothetical protein A2X40_03370 [Elusimicrobia bacterium GWC2_65_9]OHC65902.1 MAG: hypothetical protein A2040_13030 [Rhodocyclales bacterium GWA2_65_19]HAZ07341.1 chromosome condensation protein CrcB [Elusimicrobiota bacterium]
MGKWIGLVAASAAGGIARYVLTGAVYQVFGTRFPYGTLVVNLSGCFLIGVLNSLSEIKFLLGPNARMLLIIGFCGAFTTLSTLMLESSNLMKNGDTVRAFANVAATIVIGFFLFRMGEVLGTAMCRPWQLSITATTPTP